MGLILSAWKSSGAYHGPVDVGGGGRKEGGEGEGEGEEKGGLVN